MLGAGQGMANPYSAVGGLVGSVAGYGIGSLTGPENAAYYAQVGSLVGGIGGGGLDPSKQAQCRVQQMIWDSAGAAAGAGMAGLAGFDPLMGAQYGMMTASMAKQFACFAAGTPLLTLDGHKLLEDFRVGDLILSRHDEQPDGPVLPKRVEEVFVRHGRILTLTVAGQTIRTTGEHPFYVVGKGWTPASGCQPGDRILGLGGQSIPIEEVASTEDVSKVYNLRVADFHTYFVGSQNWNFTAWAHNQYTGPERAIASTEEVESLRRLEQKAIEARQSIAESRTNGGKRTYRVGYTQEQLLDRVLNPSVAAEHVETGISATGVALGDRRPSRPAILTTTDDLVGASGSFSYHAEGKASFRVVGQMEEQGVVGGTMRLWIDTPGGPCVDFCRGLGGLQTVSDRAKMTVQAYYRSEADIVHRLTYIPNGGRDK